MTKQLKASQWEQALEFFPIRIWEAIAAEFFATKSTKNHAAIDTLKALISARMILDWKAGNFCAFCGQDSGRFESVCCDQLGLKALPILEVKHEA